MSSPTRTLGRCEITTPAAGTHTADTRLIPAYYTDAAASPYVADLLARCRTVFDIKPVMCADLDTPGILAVASGGFVADDAHVEGLVIVQAGARIEAGAHVVGPVLICSGAVVAAGALVRDHSVIGPGCRIGFAAEITRSLLVADVLAKHPCFVGDSVIGRGVNIGAFCSTTGLRCDRGPVAEPATEEITITLDGQRIGTRQTKFGAVIGDGVALPAGTVLSPGTLIGPGTVIYPRDHVGGFLPAGARVR
ncbi:hypothetical protein [Microtetraspora fusca]|uniref:hypothetical protein n=1 Tax=Microtetraspora fusca TaxID=1997 RepID=UPI00082AE545|nr:hypothetical protein [Microtetraspora fusca]